MGVRYLIGQPLCNVKSSIWLACMVEAFVAPTSPDLFRGPPVLLAIRTELLEPHTMSLLSNCVSRGSESEVKHRVVYYLFTAEILSRETSKHIGLVFGILVLSSWLCGTLNNVYIRR
jgi:hypothetical protein